MSRSSGAPSFHPLADAAAILGVSVRTLRRRIAAGKIAAFQDGPGRSYRISSAALASYIRERTLNREVA